MQSTNVISTQTALTPTEMEKKFLNRDEISFYSVYKETCVCVRARLYVCVRVPS
jgi:hypothetical protein